MVGYSGSFEMFLVILKPRVWGAGAQGCGFLSEAS